MGSATGWGHGYYTSVPYTTGFFRETAPNWLDFAALISGQAPPRQQEGDAFQYLDLGCGMGFGLCLMAALYPEGQFVGVDFNPDHIGHASSLAEALQLTNIRFLEADFLSLPQKPALLGIEDNGRGAYDYVVAHGIATWVAPAVREALLSIGAACLAVRGLLYVSYNCLPGWLPLTTYQQLVKLELRRHGGVPSAELFRQCAERLQNLVGNNEQTTPLSRMVPSLRQELIDLPSRNINYLYGEYGHEQWQPLYVGDLHQQALDLRLTPVATATLPELFDDLLAPSLQEAVLGEREPLLRQTLIDLATFKGFRRDIFVRGSVRLSPEQRRTRLEAVPLRLQEAPPLTAYEFSTSFGLVRGEPDVYRGVEAAMANGGRRFGQLMVACDQPLPELERIVALLLHEGRLALDRGEAGDAARAGCDQVNGQLLARIREGWSYNRLAAASIGSAVELNLIEAEVVANLGRRPADAAWAAQLQARLERIGVALTSEDDKSPVELLGIAQEFQQRRLAWWERLGFAFPEALSLQ